MERQLEGVDISILYRCNQKYYDKALSEYGIGYTHLILLLGIYENEGISMNELAYMGSFDKGTITKSIQKLEQLGYVEIRNSLVDKRSKELFSSIKAKEFISKLYLLRQEWNDYLGEDIAKEDLEKYFEVMSKIIDRAKKYNLYKQEEDIRIYGFQKLSLLDYPQKMAALVFTGGCNFRCPFCHNKSLVFLNEQEGEINPEYIFDYLEKRKKMLDGVCISGGEPLLQVGLENFIRRIKDMGLLVKIDTNGTSYEKLKDLVEKGLIDYVAMDIKNIKSEYAKTIGLDKFDISEVEKCVNYLKEEHVDYEFRTTLVKEFHEGVDFNLMGSWLNGAKNYYLQNFEDRDTCICSGLHPLDKEEIYKIEKIMRPYVKNIAIRGI